MTNQVLRTHHVAEAVGVHANTIRLYEEQGFLFPVPRDANGYRRYSLTDIEQVRLVRLALQWPYLGDKNLLLDLVTRAAGGDLGMAMELAYQYLARVRVERTYAEAAFEFLERWAAGYVLDLSRERVTIGVAAARLNVSVDMLRSWERNGLIAVPRDPGNQYRRYGAVEFGRLRVIRTLAQAGYSQMAILTMLRRVDSGNTADLRSALDLPPDDEASIYTVADRWLSTLAELEQRAQAIIRQVGLLIERCHCR
ncbi:MAG: MerR family DNA-binding transcriptional regulator [Oscillochloris sp.]|nr:MerR family DNA-binding transcriptional regulator [Oscillochloris sp.]